MNKDEVKVVEDVVTDATKNVAEEIACTTKPNGTGLVVMITTIGVFVAGVIWLGKKAYAHFKGTKEETAVQEITTEVVEEKPEENIEAKA